MARVQFEHVYKRFGKVEVVHDVSLDIKDKEFLVLVGPSGCGKSTALRMVAGLEEPSEGEIFIGDRLVNGVDPKDRDIAMVFQNYALYPHMTVFDNMAFGLKLRHFPKNEITKRVEDAAGILRPEHLEDAQLVGANGTGSFINATVDVVENLGNELQVYFTTSGINAVATLNARSRVSAGDKVRLSVDTDQIHLFDSDTGEAIF